MILTKKFLLFIVVFQITACSFSNKAVEIDSSHDLPQKTSVLSDKATLDEYVLYALSNSADVRSAFNLYKAALEKAPQVSVLPEPRLTYAYFIDSIETRVGPMQHRVGLSQPIPWFGKLSLKGEIANEEAKAAYYSFMLRKNKLVSDVIKAYYELAYLNEAKQITEATLELLKRWEQVLIQRYRSQTGTQADLIKVQVELGKLEDKLKELKDFEDPLKAEFNSLLNRPVSSSISLKANILSNKLDKESQGLLNQSNESLKNILKEQNPKIQLIKALIEASEKGISLAKKDYYPDFQVGADYTFVGRRAQAGDESGDDGIAAVLSLSIPINFSKYNAGLREAKFKQQAAQDNLTSSTYLLLADLTRNIFDISDSKRRIDLFGNTLIPKAEEALESTFTAFESGESSFLDLLDTERELLDFQLMLSRAQADFFIKSSELKALLGDYSKAETKFKGEAE